MDLSYGKKLEIEFQYWTGESEDQFYWDNGVDATDDHILAKLQLSEDTLKVSHLSGEYRLPPYTIRKMV